MSISERKKELKRRRHRRKKVDLLKRRVAKATASEKTHIAAKVRKLTLGAERIIAKMGLEER
jgi:hypothetical protein